MNSTLIDGKSHEDVSRIFKRVKTFISYDAYTAYSIFATLCGCESIVVPEKGVEKEIWYPDKKDRDGIAYGFDDLDHARETAHRVKMNVAAAEDENQEIVSAFCRDAIRFFSDRY